MNNKKTNEDVIVELTCQYVTEEIKQAKIKNLYFYLSTRIQWYKSDFFKNSYKLCKNLSQKFELISCPFLSQGVKFLQSDNECDHIFVFLNHFNLSKKFEDNFDAIKLLETSFHELRHKEQDVAENNFDLNYFIFKIVEEFLLIFDSSFYRSNHDSFLIEIDASLYAWNKCLNISKTYHLMYDKFKEYINSYINYWNFQYYNYDFNKIFSRFFMLYDKFLSQVNEENIFELLFYDRNEKKFNTLDRIINIYNNGTTIVDDKKLYIKDYVDKRIIYYVITTDAFMDTLNYEDLSEIELKYFNDAINYKFQEFQEKIKYFSTLVDENSNNNFLVNDLYKIKEFILRIRKKILMSFNNIKSKKRKV